MLAVADVVLGAEEPQALDIGTEIIVGEVGLDDAVARHCVFHHLRRRAHLQIGVVMVPR
jgi:hypothetical protein